jgi:aspartate racemase
MLTEVAAAVRARGLKRVALLGTRFTIESRMFGCLDDTEVVMPQADEIERIHRIYSDFVAGRGSDTQAEELRKLAQTFVARDGAQAVLIAGTDLSTVFTEGNAGFPMIDCASVHIGAIVRRLFK